MGPLSFTVLMPVWAGDRAAPFAQALASLSAQAPRPTRILICQDGPLPPDLDIIAADFVAAHGARRLVNPGSPGLAANLNHAIGHVETPWVARADADDINLADRFAAQCAFLEAHPEIDALGGAIIEFFPDGRERLKALPGDHAAITALAAWRNPINHMTAFFRTDALRACGGYQAIPLKEDYALWLAFLERGFRLANLPRPLVRARLGANFHRRRAGLNNLASEFALFRRKSRIPTIGPTKAAAAFVLRSASLSAESGARIVYERFLRAAPVGRSRQAVTPLPGQTRAS